MPVRKSLVERVDAALANATTPDEKFRAVHGLLRGELRARGHEVSDDASRAVVDRYVDSFVVSRTAVWRIMGQRVLDAAEGVRQAINAASAELQQQKELGGQEVTVEQVAAARKATGLSAM